LTVKKRHVAIGVLCGWWTVGAFWGCHGDLATTGFGDGQSPDVAGSMSLTEHEAGEVAIETAAAHGYVVDDYHMRSERLDDGWMLSFDRKEKKPYLGGDNHFGVRITDKGVAHLFHGR
jgi:hypothetical protein